MSDEKPLSDIEIYDRLFAAVETLGKEDGVTARGDTTIKAARQALKTLQFGLIAAMENSEPTNKAIIDPSKVNGR